MLIRFESNDTLCVTVPAAPASIAAAMALSANCDFSRKPRLLFFLKGANSHLTALMAEGRGASGKQSLSELTEAKKVSLPSSRLGYNPVTSFLFNRRAEAGGDNNRAVSPEIGVVFASLTSNVMEDARKYEAAKYFAGAAGFVLNGFV